MSQKSYLNLAAGEVRLPESTVANLPAVATSTGKTFIVSDATSASVLGSGGGSTVVIVRSTGSTWAILGGGAGASVIASAAPGTSTNSTTSTVLATVALPVLTTGAMVRITMRLTHEGGTAALPKSGLQLAGVDVLASQQWGASTYTTAAFTVHIRITGSSAQYIDATGIASSGAPIQHSLLTGTAAVNTSVPTSLTILGSMGSSTSETVTLRHYSVEVIPAT